MPGIESPNNGGDSPSQGQKKFTEITEKIKGRSFLCKCLPLFI